MKKENKFWDRWADSYAKKPVANEAAYQKKLEVTQTYLKPDMDVFEFGCGTGTTALIHAPYVKHILATDISAKMLEIAQRKADEGKVKNVTFQQASIDDFKAPDETFDVVLGLSILHLLEDKEDVISKVHKMLKPDGVFVTSTVCIGKRSLFKLVWPFGRLFGLFPFVDFFNKEDLMKSLTSHGFKIEYDWQPDKSMGVFIVAKKV